MNWLIQIETELQRIRSDDNPGRTRTIARRIAGISIQQYYHGSVGDFLTLLQSAVNDSSIPVTVRDAVDRLIARLDADFTSPSVDPISDAMIVVEFVKEHVTTNNR